MNVPELVNELFKQMPESQEIREARLLVENMRKALLIACDCDKRVCKEQNFDGCERRLARDFLLSQKGNIK
jgi:hypothetical protein